MYKDGTDYFDWRAAMPKPKTVKALFLDIDGVLVTWQSLRKASNSALVQPSIVRDARKQLDQRGLTHLLNLLRDTKARVVLSSTWRMVPQLAETIWNALGIPEDERHTTPRLDGIRGHEVALYLHEHPEVGTYAILDDDADFLDDQLPRLVQTTMQWGLTRAHARRLKKLLNG